MKTAPQTCPRCRTELPAGVPPWLCPKCLLAGLANALAEPERVSPDPKPLASVPDGKETLPQVLGGYELLERIGQGGMGVVYRARQLSLGRTVAVKLLPYGVLATEEKVQRFRTEAEAAGSLQHPNIVGIYEVGVCGDQHFLVMEYVEGPTLAELARGGPLPSGRAARYVQSIAEAVHHAHEHGILHRDLKPSNVLIDANDQPRITDFGLAKRLESSSELTLTGQVLGSPQYMPPEQAAGRQQQVTRRSDVYALGAILYHLLTGRPPFIGQTLSEILPQVTNDDPLRPRRLNPAVPPDLETVCLKCLEKTPHRRYPTALALAEELGRFLRREPILARPIGVMGKAWRWCRRNPALATLGAAVNLLLIALAVGGPIMASQQRAAAERYRRLAYAGDVKAAHDWWQRANLQQAVNALDRHVPQAGQSDLREFAWRHVNRLCQPYRQTRTLQAASIVFHLATTPDSQWLAESGTFDFVRIWDLESGTDVPAREFKADESGESHYAGPVSFSPDGRYFVTGGFSKERNKKGLQIWDRTTWQRLTNYPELAGRSCDFSPDGKLLAVAVDSAVVLLRVHGDWEQLRPPLTNHTSVVWSVRFSGDGQRLVSASADKTALVWDATTWEPVTVLSHTNSVYNALFSPDARQVATASGETVRLWDPATQRELGGYSHQNVVMAVDFSPDGRFVASGGYDGLVKLWNWQADVVRELRGHSRAVNAVKFVPGGSLLASGSWDETIKLWDLSERPPNDILEGRTFEPIGILAAQSPVAFSRDGATVATLARNPSDILLWDTATGAPRPSLTADRALLSPEGPEASADTTKRRTRVGDLAFSPRDGALAAVRNLGSEATPLWRIEFWDVHRRTVTNSFAGQAPIRFSPDGRWFACQGVEDGTIQFCDLETGRRWTSQGGFEVSPDRNDFAFSPDGRWLASTGIELVLWETASGRRDHILVDALRNLELPVNTAAFTPDGRWLIAGDSKAEMQVWDLARRRRVGAFRGHRGSLVRLAISPDAKTLASGSLTGEIKLWRLEPPDGRLNTRWEIRELLTLAEGSQAILDLQFCRTSDGEILGSSDAAGVVRLWRAEAGPSQSQDHKPPQGLETSQ
ncbi:MAG: protein kinase [Verrucomicrobia bacterium]|nr:protein kinase [Verrucomicrobiota bacterium]